MPNTEQKIYDFVATGQNIQGWGQNGVDVLAKSMGSTDDDRDFIARHMSSVQTSTVCLSDKERPDLEEELERLIGPNLPLNIDNVSLHFLLLPEILAEGPSALRHILSLQLQRSLQESPILLYQDLLENSVRLDGTINFSAPVTLSLAKSGINSVDKGWHIDGPKSLVNKTSITAIRCPGPYGAHFALRGHFCEHSLIPNKFNVNAYGRAGPGLSTFRRGYSENNLHRGSPKVRWVIIIAGSALHDLSSAYNTDQIEPDIKPHSPPHVYLDDSDDFEPIAPTPE